MQVTCMRFDIYMDIKSISDQKMAEDLGVTRQAVWMWRNKKKVPRDAMKKKIQILVIVALLMAAGLATTHYVWATPSASLSETDDGVFDD